MLHYPNMFAAKHAAPNMSEGSRFTIGLLKKRFVMSNGRILPDGKFANLRTKTHRTSRVRSNFR